MLKSINLDQRLYVMPCGNDGYSCLGFDVCEERIKRYRQWLDDTHASVIWGDDAKPGTPERYEQYAATLAAVHEHTRVRNERCPADLTEQLVGLEGKRVEVVDRYGEKRRFIVGKSTGWLPIHLEIARRTDDGGGAVTGAPFKSVTVVGQRR